MIQPLPINHNLLPTTWQYPFHTVIRAIRDIAAKAPSPEALQNLTIAPMKSVPSPGRCYIESDQPKSSRDDDRRSAFERLMSDLDYATTKEVRSALPEVVKKALGARDEVSGKMRFEHASDAKNISRVLTAAFALSLN